MSAVERGSSLDDCALSTRVVAAQHAGNVHPTAVPPLSDEQQRANLEILRRSRRAILRRLTQATLAKMRERGQ
jgi:hypothetical protein